MRDPSALHPAAASLRAPALALAFACVATSCSLGVRAGADPEPASAIAEAPETAKPTDYVALGSRLRAAIEGGYHSPPELDREPWTAFWTDLEAGFAEAETDRDALHAFDMAVRSLGMSHLHLYGPRPAPRAAGGIAAAPPVHVRYEVRPGGSTAGGATADGVAVLRIDRFLLDETAGPIADALRDVAERRPAALVLDLRQCSGGDLAAMTVAAHLVAEPTPIGLFIARPWWDGHDRVPAPEEWSGLPHVREPDLGAFFEALSGVGAAVGVATPAEPRYDGPVYVLTSPETASAAEPLVHLLKTTGRATVVGERTMGAMLSSDRADLGGGWTLVYPGADYFTAEGGRLEGVGIEPDVAAPSNRALTVALGLIADRPVAPR